jgi:hypothetical protein
MKMLLLQKQKQRYVGVLRPARSSTKAEKRTLHDTRDSCCLNTCITSAICFEVLQREQKGFTYICWHCALPKLCVAEEMPHREAKKSGLQAGQGLYSNLGSWMLAGLSFDTNVSKKVELALSANLPDAIGLP